MVHFVKYAILRGLLAFSHVFVDSLPPPQGHNAALRYGNITADGQRLLTASGDRQITVWDISTGEAISKLERVMGSRVKAVATSADGTVAVVVLFDSSIGVWDLSSGTCRLMLQKRGARMPGAGHVGGVNAVYLTADGQHAVTVSKVRCMSLMLQTRIVVWR